MSSSSVVRDPIHTLPQGPQDWRVEWGLTDEDADTVGTALLEGGEDREEDAGADVIDIRPRIAARATTDTSNVFDLPLQDRGYQQLVRKVGPYIQEARAMLEELWAPGVETDHLLVQPIPEDGQEEEVLISVQFSLLRATREEARGIRAELYRRVARDFPSAVRGVLSIAVSFRRP